MPWKRCIDIFSYCSSPDESKPIEWHVQRAAKETLITLGTCRNIPTECPYRKNYQEIYNENRLLPKV